MENEITFPSRKKDLAPSIGLRFFKGKTSHLHSITESHGTCTCHFRARTQVPAPPAWLDQTLSLPTVPLWGQRGHLGKLGLPLANPLNILISSSPVAEKAPASTSKMVLSRLQQRKKKGKRTIPSPRCSSRNKGKLGGSGPLRAVATVTSGTTPPGQAC